MENQLEDNNRLTLLLETNEANQKRAMNESNERERLAKQQIEALKSTISSQENMIGEVEEMNGKMEGQLLERVAHEAALNDQLANSKARLDQLEKDIISLKAQINELNAKSLQSNEQVNIYYYLCFIASFYNYLSFPPSPSSFSNDNDNDDNR
jgi:septal ring factor EnvC (AmiA/AmiB activator)